MILFEDNKKCDYEIYSEDNYEIKRKGDDDYGEGIN